MTELTNQPDISQERVLLELARIAFANATDIVGLDGIVQADAAPEGTAALYVKVKSKDESGEREVHMYDKLKALELLGKHLGMFSGGDGVNDDMGVEIIYDIPKDTD